MAQQAIKVVRSKKQNNGHRQDGVKWYTSDSNGDIVQLSDKKQKKVHKYQRLIRKNRHVEPHYEQV